jgi:flagellar hook assembly protein FlgD
VYDFSGKEIAILVSENQTEGTHTIQWNGLDSGGNKVKCGMYFYQLKDKTGIATKKMMVME